MSLTLDQLPEFKNEPLTDFSSESNRTAMIEALAKVRGEFGNEHELLIDGVRQKGAKQFNSINPSKPSEVIGVHHGASPEQAARAVEAANEYFPAWKALPASERAGMLLKLAQIIRDRKLEFDAWQVYEAGKTWIEADADVSEAIDFCDYYARLALQYDSPDPVPQFPGERDELRYIPLGVGVVIPPWNFPLAILLGTATAALVAGNTIVLKPSSDTPTNAAKFVEAALEAGFPPKALSFVTGGGGEIGDTLVEHPKTRFISFTGSKEVGLRINQLAATPRPGQIWIKRVVAEMGGKDGIVVDSEADLDAAVHGVFVSAFGFQGQKCSACSRAIVDEKIYDEFLEKLKAKADAVKVGQSDDPGNYMGPVINEKARQSILNYIEVGKGEGRLICGGGPAEGDGYFIQPTIIADIDSKARIFQEEIFGPVLAVSKARDFNHAMELANDTEYGLTGSVYTTNRDKIRQASDEFHVGNLYFNRKSTGAMVACHPFGGFNMS